MVLRYTLGYVARAHPDPNIRCFFGTSLALLRIMQVDCEALKWREHDANLGAPQLSAKILVHAWSHREDMFDITSITANGTPILGSWPWYADWWNCAINLIYPTITQIRFESWHLGIGLWGRASTIRRNNELNLLPPVDIHLRRYNESSRICFVVTEHAFLHPVQMCGTGSHDIWRSDDQEITNVDVCITHPFLNSAGSKPFERLSYLLHWWTKQEKDLPQLSNEWKMTPRP